MASQHSRRTGSVTWLRTSGRQDHLKPWQRWEEKPALNEIIYLPSQSRHPSTPSSWAPWCLPESWLLTQESVAIPWSSLLSFLWGADQTQACFRCFELLYYFSLKSPPLCQVATCHPATGLCARVPAYRRKMTLFVLSSLLQAEICSLPALEFFFQMLTELSSHSKIGKWIPFNVFY